jgi:hypothetical protein
MNLEFISHVYYYYRFPVILNRLVYGGVRQDPLRFFQSTRLGFTLHANRISNIGLQGFLLHACFEYVAGTIPHYPAQNSRDFWELPSLALLDNLPMQQGNALRSNSLILRCTAGLLDSLVKVESVLGGMEQCSWVYLAYHTVQDTFGPIQSAFCLQN